ncbi:Os02g0487166 [Oryza sativa Japonica Group]|nr:Os02g0487166 [Oryza sativa Japonica Group]
MQLSGKPTGRKKEKEKQRQHSDQSQIDALDHLWVKKKEADVEKEWQRAERCKVASALDQQQIDLEKEMFEFKRMIVEDRIMRLDTRVMSIEEQD